MKPFYPILAVFLILISFQASAELIVDYTPEIAIEGSNYEMPVTIRNPDASVKRVQVQFLAPVNYTIENLSNELAGNSRMNFKIIIDNNPDLKGSEYTSVLEIKTNEETVRKNILLEFIEEDKEEVNYNSVGSGLVALFDSKKENQNTNESPQNQIPATGLFNFTPIDFSFIGTGIFAMPEFDIALGGMELALNILLIIVAAFLLVGFIARLNKRIQYKRRYP